MIIVIGGIKGGPGKTTIATNLTVLRSQKGKKVLLVDADEQKSASVWSAQRDALAISSPWTTIQLSGRAVHTELQKLSAHYDDIIVDTGGRDNSSQRSALTVASVFLVPFRPRSLDIWTIGDVAQLISEVKVINPKLLCYTVINQGDASGNDNKEAKEILSECEHFKCFPNFLGNRKSFASATAKGLAVCENKPLDKKSIIEMNMLYEMIYK